MTAPTPTRFLPDVVPGIDWVVRRPVGLPTGSRLDPPGMDRAALAGPALGREDGAADDAPAFATPGPAGPPWPFPRSGRSEPCAVCSGTGFVTVADRDRRGDPLDTVLCTGCGIVSHAVIPDPLILAAYQRSRYRLDYHGEASPSAYRVGREWRRAGRLLAWLAPYLPEGGTVCEIGAGIGCNVRRLADAGYAARGIEPGEGFSRFARQVLSADVTPTFFETFEPDVRCDAVLLVHVLEHLPDPVGALARAASWLTPGGWIYVEVPDLLAPHAAPHRRFHFAHLYNFTAETLIDAAGRAGLVTTRVQTRSEGRNLRLLLRHPLRVTTARADDDRLVCLERPQETARRVAAALARETWLSYHTRPAYLARRAGEMAGHLLDRWRGPARMKRILAERTSA